MGRVSRLARRLLSKASPIITVSTLGRNGNEIKLRFMAETPAERGRALTFNEKEPETLEWIRTYMRPGEVLWDVGANVGTYSIFAAALGLHVYAFEIYPGNCSRIIENERENFFESGYVVACGIGLADYPGVSLVHLSSFQKGSSLHVMDLGERGSPSWKEMSVYAGFSSAEHLISTGGMESPHHIKVDVDGSEQDVLEGFGDRLGLLRTASVEYHDNVLERLTDFFASHGFRRHEWSIPTSYDRNKGTRWDGFGNALFVKKA